MSSFPVATTTMAQHIIQWSVIEAHRYDNVIKTFGVYVRQKISTVIYLRAVIFVCLLAYFGYVFNLNSCMSQQFLASSMGAASSSYYFSSILIINYWVLSFVFVFLFFLCSHFCFDPKKSNEEKFISFAHCKYFHFERRVFIMIHDVLFQLIPKQPWRQ